MKTPPVLVCLWLGLWLAPLHAESRPRTLVTDSRMKLLSYSPNEVYKLVAYEGYQIDIQLDPAEQIKTIASGDTVGWQIVPAGQHVFVKPMASGARTDLSVITTRRTYVFDLVSRSAAKTCDMTYLIRFLYPETALWNNTLSPGFASAATLNFDYRISGAKTVVPLRCFDDGRFTYFQFDSTHEMPAIFVVGADTKESLVNYRIEGPYVVVERLGEFFTLRNGKAEASVINQRKLGETSAEKRGS